MPRPKKSKSVRAVALSQRVAKPQNPTAASRQSQRHLPGHDDTVAKISDGGSVTHDKVRGDDQNKENIPYMSPLKSELKQTSAKSKTLKSRRSANPLPNSHIKQGSFRLNGQEERNLAEQRSRLANSPGSTSSLTAERQAINTKVRSNVSSRRTSQAHRLQGTPLSHSSMLGALHFKKRGRQPSLLQVAQSQQELTTDIDDVDLLDLQPDDESTPLIKSSYHNQQSLAQASSNAQRSRKRKVGDAGIDVLDPRRQRRSASPLSDQVSSEEDSFDLPPDIEDEESRVPQLPRYSVKRTPSPASVSDTQAPPQSSSVSIQSPSATTRSSSSPKRALQEKELPADPLSVTVRERSTQKRSEGLLSPATKPLTTARLQNLLPRRRTRSKPSSTYDLPSSSDMELDASRLAEDEDELSFHATAKMKKAKTTKERKSKRRTTVGKRLTKEVEPLRKRVSTTYSKKMASDSYGVDEEEEDTFDTADTSVEVDADTGKVMPVLDVKAKAEMKRLADKFKDVDDFDMEFEDVTGSSSQMLDAR